MGADLSSGKQFWGSAGRWATERLLDSIRRGQGITPDALRTLDTLHREEWTYFDQVVVEEGVIRLRGVADLIAAGLVRNVPNSMGKTIYEWDKVTDMNPAIVSLDGMVMAENDNIEYDQDALPLPITHKDWFLNLRRLEASRLSGEALDTTMARVAGRLVAEKAEYMLFNGASKNYRSLPIYGYTTHPNRNILAYGTNGAWTNYPTKTGENMVADIIAAKALLEADRMYGPYVVYMGGTISLVLDNDFKANSDLTIRQRLLQIEGISAIRVSDQMPAGSIVVVQMTPDVVVWVQGERLQNIQWDINGGFGIHFKTFQIGVPLIRADVQGRSGVVHIS